MVDFVGLLKRTIDAQSNPTPALRRRIYDRTRETVEKQLTGRNAGADILLLQRRMLEKAISEVEACYAAPARGRADVFAALQQNAGMQAGAPPRPGAWGGGYAAPQAPDSAEAEEEAFAAYGGPAEVRPPPAAAARPAPGGNAYFARAGGAYGGGYAEERQFGSRGGAGDFALIQLDEDEDDERRFTPYGQNGGAAARQESYGSESGAFVRPGLGAPAAPLPDFGSAAPFSAAETVRRAEAEPEEYRPPLSPYHIERETVSEAFGSEPERGGGGARFSLSESAAETAPPANAPSAAAMREGGGRAAAEEPGHDFSSLHNFLFGEAKPAAPASAYQPPRGAAADASFAAPDFTAETERAGEAGGEGFSPLPDFLSEAPEETRAEPFSAARPETAEPFDFDGLSGRERGGKAAPQDEPLSEALPEALFAPQDPAEADVLLPEMQSRAAAEDSGSLSGGAGSPVAPGIFAQAAMREKRRSSKKRLLTGGAVLLALAALFGGIIWFLTDFLPHGKPGPAAERSAAAQTMPAGGGEESGEKANQRLTADGREVSAAPPPQQQNAPAAAKTEAAAEAAGQGEALFREARTALMPAADTQGAVVWTLLTEKTPGGAQDTALRGDLSIPGRDMVMRLTLRPNHDKSIPAVYLAELMFILPENFEGVAVDKISPLMFKATAQSTGQELLDSRVYKISDNFFVITLNSPENGRNPKLQRNIALMEQLPWLSLNVAYKNGRIGELNFAKGDKGEALFKQFFDAQSPADQGMGAAPAGGGS